MIRMWHQRERARLRRALNAPASSRWENLGLWSHAGQPYTEAARALAMRVGRAASLGAGDRVLDLGPGVGHDQATLWRETFGIGEYYGQERDTPAPVATIWQHVVAVDSAYFIADLWARLEALWPQIAPGGAITWTDLYLAAPSCTPRRLHLTSRLTGIDPAHWLTRAQWQTKMATLAGPNATFTDLTDEVLAGFVRHVDERRRGQHGARAPLLARGTAALLRPLLDAGAIGYGLLQLRRPAP